MVFGGVIEKAKVANYNAISNGSNILFIGGGSGISLVKLLSLEKNLTIDYVDASQKMIVIAQRRVGESEGLNFYHTPIEKFDGAGYDFIITEFIFDLFTKEEIGKLVRLINSKLKIGGFWIDTDFRKPILMEDRILLKLMYYFFKATSAINTSNLVETKPIMIKEGFKIKKNLKFKSGFISSYFIVRN